MKIKSKIGFVVSILIIIGCIWFVVKNKSCYKENNYTYDEDNSRKLVMLHFDNRYADELTNKIYELKVYKRTDLHDFIGYTGDTLLFETGNKDIIKDFIYSFRLEASQMGKCSLTNDYYEIMMFDDNKKMYVSVLFVLCKPNDVAIIRLPSGYDIDNTRIVPFMKKLNIINR